MIKVDLRTTDNRVQFGMFDTFEEEIEGEWSNHTGVFRPSVIHWPFLCR